ncbi:uncharacterized protein N7477_008591 [Penicillium maclennaniae]|uniref:uncharacterized protein n=1 Tax=Penicillium maclennaniae TaxID=1343394 RepID=UPI002541DB4A|nr:uncharacterized protein N7477_008591 [Penicillium maclennaniae]KAJ5666143.1 hypothetical protein N7477_008591 [Penicillium maclennaniae]
MDTRLLARGLRARPSAFLLTRQQPQRFFPTTIRHNSSDSSSQHTSSQTPTEAATPATTPNAEKSMSKPTSSGSDFDDILNKLNLGTRTKTEHAAGKGQGRVNSSLSRGLGFKEQSAQLASRKTELKLGPTLGRQVHVEPERGVDLGAAIRNLNMVVNANKIKQQSFQQKFHVRKGMVRKQQRRERWRKLFRFSFQETVKKIQRMQAQGW